MSELSKKKIAITGSMGSGKSQVSTFVQECGYPVLNMDSLNATLLEPGNEGYQALVQEDWIVLDAEKRIDKKEMAKVLFSNLEIKERVEGILHPLLKDKSIQWMQEQTSPLVFVEVPLLFETGWQDLFDSVWCVVVSQDVALQRLTQYRGFTKTQALERLQHQMSPEYKMERSHYVLYNEGSLEQLYQQVHKGLEKEKE